MADWKQVMIGVNQETHARLAEKKQALEEAVDQHFSWGTFLSILAGLQPMNEKDQKEFKGIPSWVSKKEVKQIARAEGNRILRSLKGVNVSR